MSTLKQQAISSSKWNFVDRLGVLVIQFILGVIMARLLLPSDYGTIGLLAIFFEISQAFIDSGFSSALIRTKKQTEEDFCTVFYFNLAVSVTTYIVLFLVAPWIAVFFNIPLLQPIIRVQAVTLILNALMAVQVSILHINLDFKTLAKRNITATLASGIVGITLAYFNFGVWSLVWQQVTSTAISLIIIISTCKWIPRKGFHRESFSRLGSFGSKLLFSSLLHTIYLNATTLLIGKFYSAKDLGFYSRADQFSNIPRYTLDGTLQTVSYPILSKIQNNDRLLLFAYKKYIRYTSLFMFIASGLLCSLAEPIILLLLTEKWANAVIYLHIFAFSSMFDHLSSINLNLLKVKGRSDLFLKLEIIKKTISITMLLCAIPFGVLAICLSKLIYNHIAIFINTYYSGKFFNLGYLKQAKEFMPFFIKSIFSCIPAYTTTLLNLPHVHSIIIGTTTALTLYYFSLRNNTEMKELIHLFKLKIKNGHYRINNK